MPGSGTFSSRTWGIAAVVGIATLLAGCGSEPDPITAKTRCKEYLDRASGERHDAAVRISADIPGVAAPANARWGPDLDAACGTHQALTIGQMFRRDVAERRKQAALKRRAKNLPVKLEGQLILKGVEGSDAAGIAVLAKRGGDSQLVVQAKLPVSPKGEAYEVWFYNSPSNARTLGAQVTDRKGNFQGAGPLPPNYRDYKYIDISRELTDSNTKHSGESVLRGKIADVKDVPNP